MSLIRPRDYQNEIAEQTQEQIMNALTAVLGQGSVRGRSQSPAGGPPAGYYDEDGNWVHYYCAGDPVGEFPVGP